MKGLSPLIGFVIYTAIVISALSILIANLTPVIQNIKDGLEIKNAEKTLKEFDERLNLISLGEFSSTDLDVEFNKGVYIFNNTSNSISYEIETEKRIFPASMNVKVGIINYTSQEKKVMLILKYNQSLVKLTGNNFRIFPRGGKIILKNSGFKNDVLQIEVKRG